MTLSLVEMALLWDVGYHVSRQMRRACRDDGTLAPRLAGLMDKLFRACELHPARWWFCIVSRDGIRVSPWCLTMRELYATLKEQGWKQIGLAYTIGTFYGDLMAWQ